MLMRTDGIFPIFIELNKAFIMPTLFMDFLVSNTGNIHIHFKLKEQPERLKMAQHQIGRII